MKQAKGRREMFNEKIKKLRKQSQLSQEDLAEKLLISRQTITKWEGGFSFPDISNLIELSELFKVTVDYLVKGETDCAQPVNPLIKNPDFQQMVQFLYVAKQHPAELLIHQFYISELMYNQSNSNTVCFLLTLLF